MCRRTSKLGADKLVCPFRIYNSPKHFLYDFLKTLCGPVLMSVYVPTPLQEGFSEKLFIEKRISGIYQSKKQKWKRLFCNILRIKFLNVQSQIYKLTIKWDVWSLWHFFRISERIAHKVWKFFVIEIRIVFWNVFSLRVIRGLLS